jgi:hypothetical protein
MAVAVLTPKEFDYNGAEAYSDTADYVAATAVDGYEFLNDGKTIVNIKNDSGAVALTATIDVPNTCDYGGTTVHDVAIVIPFGDDWIIGPLPTHIFNAPDTGKVTIRLSAFADITACAFKMT